jgi:hypothetical protein
VSTFLSFGPAPSDGLVVEEDLSEVVAQLASPAGQWPRFSRANGAEIYVNPVSVRFAEAGPVESRRGETNIREVEIR